MPDRPTVVGLEPLAVEVGPWRAASSSSCVVVVVGSIGPIERAVAGVMTGTTLVTTSRAPNALASSAARLSARFAGSVSS